MLIAASAQAQSTDHRAWGYFLEEAALQDLHQTLAQDEPPPPTLIAGVHIVDPETGTATPPMDILLENGRIQAIGPALKASGAVRIEGAGRYAVPGLCDMHVHRLTSTAQPLLNLLHGVTCVRDMNGYAWMLRAREAAEQGERLEPRAWIAGPILTDFPMSWYSQVVTSEDDIRSAVRAHAATGYDFIKLHNSMRPARVQIVFEEAERVGIPVVGHTPHRTPLADMAAHARTIEHLKGYLVEPHLEITQEDWERISVESRVWNTPTLYTARAQTERIMQTESLVPAAELRRWRERAKEGAPLKIHVDAAQSAREITRRLIELGTPLLAGTDTGGGYPFLLYGEGLHDELAAFHALGMNPREALASATVEAARALDAEGEVGRIIEGAGADFVLVKANPLDDLAVLRRPSVVCIRGTCFDERDLDQLERDLSEIFTAASDRGAVPASETDIARWMDTTRQLHAAGYIFRDNYLEAAALALGAAGRAILATEIRAMKTNPHFSFDTSHDGVVQP